MNQVQKKSFHEANASLVNAEVLGAVKARKSAFAGSLYRNGDEWTVVRSAWILPPDATETDEDVRLYPGFVVSRNGREEVLFLSTLVRPVTDFDGNEITPNGTANQKARAIFDSAATDDEAITQIANFVSKIRVKRDVKYNAYLKSTGKSRPNTLLLEFDLV